MATMATVVAAVRKILGDEPEKVKLGAAQSDTTTETTTLVSGDIAKLYPGLILEHDDGSTGAERRRVLSTDPDNNQFSGERGYGGSTAATHSNSTYLLIEPRFPYDVVAQAVNYVIDAELYPEGIYEIKERQVTTNSDASPDYDAPASTCEEILSIIQLPSGWIEPVNITGFSPYPVNTDTSIYSTGRLFRIWEQYGVAGTDLYYVNFKEKLSLTTLSTAQERIVALLAAARAVEWQDIPRTSGPTNQGDRTVRPLDSARVAQVLRADARRLIKLEADYLRRQVPRRRRFVRG